MKHPSITALLLAVLACVFACDRRETPVVPVPTPAPASAPASVSVRIAAAASLADVLKQLAPMAQKELGVELVIDAGSSGTLAKQIQLGSPADLFFSAAPEWVDALNKSGQIIPRDAPGGRRDLLHNRLVVIVPHDAKSKPASLADLAKPEFQPLAIGDPAHVPAGKYAQQSLAKAGVWEQVKPHATGAADVRGAMSYVRSGECPAGIVYATDAALDTHVDIAFAIDPSMHDPIVYTAVVIKDAAHADAARKLLDWLGGDEAMKVFRAAGFE